jgi:hypothetical protein
MKETEKKRIVEAPFSTSFSRGSDQRGQVLNVTLAEGEEVIWQWTHRPDGTSAVTGYEIVKKLEEKTERSKR